MKPHVEACVRHGQAGQHLLKLRTEGLSGGPALLAQDGALLAEEVPRPLLVLPECLVGLIVGSQRLELRLNLTTAF